MKQTEKHNYFLLVFLAGLLSLNIEARYSPEYELMESYEDAMDDYEDYMSGNVSGPISYETEDTVEDYSTYEETMNTTTTTTSPSIDEVEESLSSYADYMSGTSTTTLAQPSVREYLDPYTPIDMEAYEEEMTRHAPDCNSGTTTPTVVKPPKPKDVCNGEVGPALDYAMRQTWIKFNNLTAFQKEMTCSNPWNYATKFDLIFPSFAHPCGTKNCSRCVQVNGFRRFDGDINYAFMGMMMNLCDVSIIDAYALILAWKGVMYRRQVPAAVWYWFDAGWDWVDDGGNLSDITKKKIPPNRDDKSFLHCHSCNQVAKPGSFDSPMFRIWNKKIHGSSYYK